MSDFNLFEQSLIEYEIKKSHEKSPINGTKSTKGIEDFQDYETVAEYEECLHTDIANERGIYICVDCGEEVQARNFDKDMKDWKSYSHTDTRHITDPSRAQLRKNEEKSIFRDVDGMGFSENVVARANYFYAQVTQGKIFRGNSRKTIIFAVIFHASKLLGFPQSHDQLIKIFGISKKAGLRGLKYVNLNSKIRSSYITPVNLVDEIMDMFSASRDQKREVREIYEKIKNKSAKINRSRPQSVGAAIVYYWTRVKGKEISLMQFAEKVGLSELTILKIAKEIEELLKSG